MNAIAPSGIRSHRHWLQVALLTARRSKDPNTQVGAVIVGPGGEIRSSGYNGFPRGIADDYRLLDRETKLQLIVHAELNAILNAARLGVSTADCTLYLAATDETGQVWGGPPCMRCSTHTIQAGVSRIISYPAKKPSKWAQELALARGILAEAGIEHHELPYV